MKNYICPNCKHGNLISTTSLPFFIGFYGFGCGGCLFLIIPFLGIFMIMISIIFLIISPLFLLIKEEKRKLYCSNCKRTFLKNIVKKISKEEEEKFKK